MVRQLEHLVDAQKSVYANALAELRAGRKRTHWMWFVFPQLAGLGRSETARFYALRSADEARAYWEHRVLGLRLREATAAAIGSGAEAGVLFGHPDDLKFRSCMTLFREVAPQEPLFGEAIGRLCRGEADPLTLRLLREGHCAA
ncbi:DUF1810 family protein [Sphingomonas xinjiangensis]